MDLYNYEDWDKSEYWSLKGYTPRTEQKKIIDEAIAALDNGYKNVIIEAGTGVGKSAIATTLAKKYNDSYILTRTKQLQKQYLKDFKYMLTEIKGRSNYRCNYKSDTYFHVSCDPCEKQLLKMKHCENCPYILAREKAIHSPNVIANYHYLYSASLYSDKWFPRDLLILDEAHKIEEFLMSMVSVELSKHYCINNFDFDLFHHLQDVKIPDYKFQRKYENPLEWIEVINKIIDICNNRMKELNNQIDFYIDEQQSMKDKQYYSGEILQTEQKMRTFRNKIIQFEQLKENIQKDDWIVILPKLKDIKNKKLNPKIEFKPITVEKYTSKLLNMGFQRILLTATIGDFKKFCEWINIKPDETYHIQQKSKFPVEKRPIYLEYIGNLSGFNKNGVPNWKTEDGLNIIYNTCEKYPYCKGVIHTTSNQQTDWIIQGLGDKLPLWKVSSDTKQNHNELDRETILNSFVTTPNRAILVGAGIKDGVDLKDDACRFQILYKVPIPRFDAQVRKRNRKDPIWLNYQTAMDIMQSYGRGVRSEEDFCDYYIFDSKFDDLFDKYGYLFNEYFVEALP